MKYWFAKVSQIVIVHLLAVWLVEPQLTSMPNRLIEARINEFANKR